MMPTFPRSPLSFRTAGFPQYGWKVGISSGAFPMRQSSLSLLPAYTDYRSVCIRSSCITWSQRESRSESGRGLDHAPPWRRGRPPPQGPSLGTRLCCPGPSPLTRPHPPHSQAHRDFTAVRLIRHAFAVRERLGDPRVVPGFRCPFSPGMPPSMTPGSSGIILVQVSDADMAFAEV
jgi:hypothetical protein